MGRSFSGKSYRCGSGRRPAKAGSVRAGSGREILTAFLGDDAAEGIDIGWGERVAVTFERGPWIPERGEEPTADAVGGGREEPVDQTEGFFKRGAARGLLFHGGGVFGGAGNRWAEGKDLVGEAGVDGARGDGIEVDGLVAQFLGEGFDEANHAGFGDTVGGEVGAGFRRAAAGERDDFGAAGRAGELRVEGAKRVKRAVEIGADGGAPAGGIGRDGRADLALEAGAADESVHMGPGGGDRGSCGGDLGPIGNIAARGGEGAGVLRHEVSLIGTGQAPDVVATGEQVSRERAADARAGAGEDEIHTGDFSR